MIVGSPFRQLVMRLPWWSIGSGWAAAVLIALAVATGMSGCGARGIDPGTDAQRDGSTGPETRSTDPSAPITISLPPPADPRFPFQHAAEVSIAAHGGHVVIAAINLHTDGPDTLMATPLVRAVGVAISHDGGDTFGPSMNPGFVAGETSDPVVRVATNGTFWLAAIGVDLAGQPAERHRGFLLHALDRGEGFAVVHDDLPVADKEWLAPTADGGMVMGADGGVWRFASEGIIAASWTLGPDWPVFGAFDDPRGAHFVFQDFIGRWSGGTSIEVEGRLRPGAGIDNGWSVPIGVLPGGGIWALYGSSAMEKTNQLDANVVLRLFAAGDLVGQEVPVSDAGATAFMPAAALDGEGRLHAIWYDSSGASGVLKYARSVSADLRQGFAPARIVDPDACPGAGWFPGFAESASDRRLREYVDLSIDGRRVHMAWTHAPHLPSRIQTSHLDF